MTKDYIVVKKRRKPCRETTLKPVKEKRFIVRKYVMARSAAEALRKEHKFKPDDVYVDDEWAKGKHFESAIGFTVPSESDMQP